MTSYSAAEEQQIREDGLKRLAAKGMLAFVAPTLPSNNQNISPTTSAMGRATAANPGRAAATGNPALSTPTSVQNEQEAPRSIAGSLLTGSAIRAHNDTATSDTASKTAANSTPNYTASSGYSAEQLAFARQEHDSMTGSGGKQAEQRRRGAPISQRPLPPPFMPAANPHQSAQATSKRSAASPNMQPQTATAALSAVKDTAGKREPEIGVSQMAIEGKPFPPHLRKDSEPSKSIKPAIKPKISSETMAELGKLISANAVEDVAFSPARSMDSPTATGLGFTNGVASQQAHAESKTMDTGVKDAAGPGKSSVDANSAANETAAKTTDDAIVTALGELSKLGERKSETALEQTQRAGNAVFDHIRELKQERTQLIGQVKASKQQQKHDSDYIEELKQEVAKYAEVVDHSQELKHTVSHASELKQKSEQDAVYIRELKQEIAKYAAAVNHIQELEQQNKQFAAKLEQFATLVETLKQQQEQSVAERDALVGRIIDLEQVVEKYKFLGVQGSKTPYTIGVKYPDGSVEMIQTFADMRVNSLLERIVRKKNITIDSSKTATLTYLGEQLGHLSCVGENDIQEACVVTFAQI